MAKRIWHDSYDQGVPPELEFEEVPVHGFLERSAREFADRPAMHFMNGTLSYAELQDEVGRLASALAGLGVKQGTRVAIQMPNLPQAVISYFAVLTLGGTAVLTNPLYTAREIEHQWNDASCEVAILADFVFDGVVCGIRDKLPVRHYVIASIHEYLRPPLRWIAPFALKKKGRYVKIPTGDGVHHFRPLIRSASGAPPRVEVDMDDLAVLQYTGGTTGVSKGAMLSHRNLSCNVQQINRWFVGIEYGREVVLTALPLFHVFGMTVSMNWSVHTAAAQVILPDPRDIEKLVGALERHRVTVAPAVPAMFNAINHFPGIDGRDLKSVKACLSGSAPLPLDVQERFESMTGARIMEGFGLTETSPVTHCNPLGGVRKIGTIGVPLSNTDARVVDVDDPTKDKPAGEEGELLLAGPQVMQGYWNMPEETAGALRDGWFMTGDLATMDEDGYFRIVGRKKDMIVAGGYNVYPDEVDDVLMAHPAVLEAATIGVPDPKRGETVKSFLVAQPGQTLDFGAIEAHCRENLAAYKVPRELEEIDELPKSTVLKVLRRELRERELKKRDGRGAAG
ncbi:MAG: long-chain fatty acid--CoA ligase [Planctomycetota bacterium]